MTTHRFAVVPSPVMNVTASARTPTEVKVTWRSPDQPNGPVTELLYVVDWQTVNVDGSQSNGQVDVVGASGETGVVYSVLLKNLKSAQRYRLKVRTFSMRHWCFLGASLVLPLFFLSALSVLLQHLFCETWVHPQHFISSYNAHSQHFPITS